MKNKRWLGVITIIVIASLCIACLHAWPHNKKSGAGADWPFYRHDVSLAGRSPLKGGLGQAPHKLWTADLGGPMVPKEPVYVDDFNGDGKLETLWLKPNSLVCRDLEGKELWTAGGLAKPEILYIRDFAGDGSRGILVKSAAGTADWTETMVSGKNGHETTIAKIENVFGGFRRVGSILPELAGEQICSFWTASGVVGYGMFWSFEQGTDKPTRRFWTEVPKASFYATHLLADMDNDGKIDAVLIGHGQTWIWDLASGKLKSQCVWGPESRNYWANIAALPLKKGEKPSLLMINGWIPGVQVIKQDGDKESVLWKQVAGGAEDQYQKKVRVGSGAPDSFMDLDGDGNLEIMATILNEHDDSLYYLVIFNANTGKRLFDKANIEIEAVDDLDGDGRMEVILHQGKTWRIANWNGNEFIDRWRGEDAEPLIQPGLTAGNPARTVGDLFDFGTGSTEERMRGLPVLPTKDSTSIRGGNLMLWRETKGSPLFLMRFGKEVWNCRLGTNGQLQKINRITQHAALGNAPPQPPLKQTWKWEGQTIVVTEAGQTVARIDVPHERRYLAPPPLVGTLGGELRVVARDGAGRQTSLNKKGKDEHILAMHSPACPDIQYVTEWPAIADMNGDGQNEFITTGRDAEGTPAVLITDADGQIKQQISPPKNSVNIALGPIGSLGAGNGRWFTVRSMNPMGHASVAAYDGRTGQQLWNRDHFGFYDHTNYSKEKTPISFALNLPEPVGDYDADGVDDLFAHSMNFYGVIGVKDNRDLVAWRDVSTVVPGHWMLRAVPILAPILHNGKQQLYFNRAQTTAILTDLNGQPIWHYELERDQMPPHQPGMADLDGDGKIEIVTAQHDGLLRAFNADPVDEKCPKCPADKPLGPLNHAGHQRWQFALPAGPVSDISAADLDGDGHDDLLCGCADGKLYALKETAGQCVTLWSVDFGRAVGAPVMADLNGDGIAEILVPVEDGRLVCLGAK